MSSTHQITVQFSGLTWRTSRVSGVFASCTEGPEAAARALARKLWGPGAHHVARAAQAAGHAPAHYIIEKELLA